MAIASWPAASTSTNMSPNQTSLSQRAALTLLAISAAVGGKHPLVVATAAASSEAVKPRPPQVSAFYLQRARAKRALRAAARNSAYAVANNPAT